MSTDDKRLRKDEAGLPEDDVKSRRELLSATAKLSAFISAVGLTGVGLSGAAMGQKGDATTPSDSKAGIRTPSDSKLKAVSPSDLKRNVRPELRERRMLPAVQKRQMKLLLNDALRTGDSRLALKRHPKLTLNRRQRQALLRVSKQDWAHLRRMKAQLAPLEEAGAMAGDTGYVFW